MTSELDTVVSYYLPVGEGKLHMNGLIGKRIRLDYLNEIHCIGCGRKTSRSFAQGYCYPCLMNSPETDKCILHPEFCEAHNGISRDMEWSENHCLQNHIVYLADTTGLKVGVTRVSQVPFRWIDQGATRAIKVAKTPNRFLAGTIEVFLKKYFNDKTNWRNMLANRQAVIPDLHDEKKRACELLEKKFGQYLVEDNNITSVNFPLEVFPEKVTALSFDRVPSIEGVLAGIKGQYLIFEGGLVFNVRKHNGYKVNVEFK